jgi:hypothetical protein
MMLSWVTATAPFSAGSCALGAQHGAVGHPKDAVQVRQLTRFRQLTRHPAECPLVAVGCRCRTISVLLNVAAHEAME